MTLYYERDGITIYCGDCLEVMPHLTPPVDAIIADLPYGTTACAWDSVIPFEPLWANYKRLIKRAGAVVLFGSQPFTSDLIMSNRAWFKYEWIWNKRNGGNFQLANCQPLKVHENICIFYKDLPAYNPIFTPADLSNNHKRGKEKNLNIKHVSSKELRYSFTRDETKRYPISILDYDGLGNECNANSRLHGSQKPVALMSYLIRTYTNPGELILDNTAGSGTTGVAAQNEGRRCIMIEQDEDYCAIAVDRLRQPSFFSLPTQTQPKIEATQEAMKL